MPHAIAVASVTGRSSKPFTRANLPRGLSKGTCGDMCLRLQTCTCTNAGTYASYDQGTPVNIRMNMTFKELNPIYSEDYEGMSDNDGVGF